MTLTFLWLASPELAAARVAQRVRQGGHDIPIETIERRFRSGVRNMLELYLPLSDVGLIYDNSSGHPILVVERRDHPPMLVYDRLRWAAIKDSAS